jgi:aspartokinase
MFHVRFWRFTNTYINIHLYIFAAGHATESFSDFVVGHGELWSAQMLSYAIKKVHMKNLHNLYRLSMT